MVMIYLDANATTPMLPEVWEAMAPYLSAGNPASNHRAGSRARNALEEARESIAALLHGHPDEVVFTSGATEANNLAIFGLAGSEPGIILASEIEHPCVIGPVVQLARQGFVWQRLSVNADGVAVVHPPGEGRLCLAALMLANHETGAVQPVAQLVEALPGIPVHCDAAAAAGKTTIHFDKLGVTTLAISAHKFHGPPGVGALLVRRGTNLRPMLFGGHQQQGRRPGTEPLALAVGMARALQLAEQQRDARHRRVACLRAQLLEKIQLLAGPVVVNGPLEGGLPHTLNLSFPGLVAEVLLMNLDLAGVCVSTGAACSSGSMLPSPVLLAMQVGPDRLRSALRFSVSHLVTEEEVDAAAAIVGQVVKRLRG